MHDNANQVFLKHCRPWFEDGNRVLEIGPECIPSSSQRSMIVHTHWDTLDICPGGLLTYPSCAPYDYPIPDGSYDRVVSTQVLEHVQRPWLWFPELARVCRPGGLVITVCPVTWPYHECPVDCWRVYPEGLRVLYEDAGLDVLAIGYAAESGETIYDSYAVGLKP